MGNSPGTNGHYPPYAVTGGKKEALQPPVSADQAEQIFQTLSYFRKGSIDRIDDILSLQEILVSTLDQSLGEGTIFGNRQINNREFLLILLGLFNEVSEVSERLVDATKPWKSYDPEELEAHTFKELIDAMFFLFEAFVFMGKSSEEVYAAYLQKWATNVTRIANRAKSQPGSESQGDR